MSDALSVMTAVLLGVAGFIPTLLVVIMAAKARPGAPRDEHVELLESRPEQISALRMPWPVARRRLEMMADRTEAVFASNKVAARIWGAATLDRSVDMIRFRFSSSLFRTDAMGYLADEIALSLGAPGVSIDVGIEMDTALTGWIVVPVLWNELAADAVLRLVPHEVIA